MHANIEKYTASLISIFWPTNVKDESKKVDAIMTEKNDAKDGKCDIKGIDKIAIIRALWQASKVAPAAILFTPDLANKNEISDEDISKALDNGYIDYLNCRVMKMDLTGDNLDTSMYNRDNGNGAAEKIINTLRKK